MTATYFLPDTLPPKRDFIFTPYIPAQHNPPPNYRAGALDYQKIPSLIGGKRRPYQHVHHFSKGKENEGKEND